MCALRCCIDQLLVPSATPDPRASTQSSRRSLPTPASTAGAQSGPRLACALYVSISMQMNDMKGILVPCASTGRAWHMGSFLRSFTFRQILSFLHGYYAGKSQKREAVLPTFIDRTSSAIGSISRILAQTKRGQVACRLYCKLAG